MSEVLEAGFFQSLGMVLSILVIRILSGEEGKESLARYVFALQLQGALTLLIDTGISVGLMSQGALPGPTVSVLGASLRRRCASGDCWSASSFHPSPFIRSGSRCAWRPRWLKLRLSRSSLLAPV